MEYDYAELELDELLEIASTDDLAMEESVNRLENAHEALYGKDKDYVSFRIIAGPKEIDKIREKYEYLKNRLIKILKHVEIRRNIWTNSIYKIINR